MNQIESSAHDTWSIKEAIVISLLVLFFGAVILEVSRYIVQDIRIALYVRAYLLLGTAGFIPLLWLKFIKKLPIHTIGFKKCSSKYYIYGLILISILLISQWIAAKSIFKIPSSDIPWRVPVLAIAISLGIIIPMAEEIYYRGVLFSALKNRLGTGISLIISSLIFAMMHFPKYFNNPYWFVPFVSSFLLGMIFAVLYHFSRSLFPSIVCHSLVNLYVLFAAFFITH